MTEKLLIDKIFAQIAKNPSNGSLDRLTCRFSATNDLVCSERNGEPSWLAIVSAQVITGWNDRLDKSLQITSNRTRTLQISLDQIALTRFDPIQRAQVGQQNGSKRFLSTCHKQVRRPFGFSPQDLLLVEHLLLLLPHSMWRKTTIRGLSEYQSMLIRFHCNLIRFEVQFFQEQHA